MNKYKFQKVAPIALAVAMAAPLASHAESNFQTGAGALSAAANVDFTIVIPKILFLQVGTGALYTTNAAVNLITFTVPAASIGNGTPVAASAGSGDLGNGTVTAIVRGNNGNITLSTASVGAMGNGAGDTIPWSQVTTTPAALTTGTVLTPAAIPASGSTSVTLTAVAKIVNQDARWTYGYLNTNIVAPGTYGGAGGTNNGRVTYTATLP
jgi:hypothetical protein